MADDNLAIHYHGAFTNGRNPQNRHFWNIDHWRGKKTADVTGTGDRERAAL